MGGIPPIAPPPHHERLRDRLADRLLSDIDSVVRGLVSLLTMLTLIGIVMVSFAKAASWEETSELLDRVLPAVTLVLGALGSHYFRKDK